MNKDSASKNLTKQLIHSLCMTVLLVLSVVTYGQRVTVPPSAPADSVTAPKWLAAPTLDGQDKDWSYAQAGILKMTDASSRFTIQVMVLHSGLDLYLYFSAMPRSTDQDVDVRRIAVRVDSDHSRSETVIPGDYEFSVDVKGTLNVAQGDGKGSFVPLKVPANDFAAVVSYPMEQSWSAELRISLEWFGGYARTDGLNLALEAEDGTTLQQWPASAKALSPTTWGDLVLDRIYPEKVTAGSAFLDGREGYLVVPYAPEQLNPSEITIEAWVRVVDGDCGTLIGNGQAASYWLALCKVVQFGHDGKTSVRSGQQPLGDGWHHVAVTMDEEGMRTLYLDGQVDLQVGFEIAEEEREGEPKERAKLGVSDRMLRIGSDRDALDDHNHLHGYVRELRIWNRARSAQEIRDKASIDGEKLKNEPGLVACWPFTKGLQDIVGGHDAGLIGNASLAHEAPDMKTFPEPPAYEPYTYPGPKPIPAWDAIIPQVSGEVTLDGVCRPSEYK